MVVVRPTFIRQVKVQDPAPAASLPKGGVLVLCARRKRTGLKYTSVSRRGLRTTFADVVSFPLPDQQAALMRRLPADRDARLGEDQWGKRNRNVERY